MNCYGFIVILHIVVFVFHWRSGALRGFIMICLWVGYESINYSRLILFLSALMRANAVLLWFFCGVHWVAALKFNVLEADTAIRYKHPICQTTNYQLFAGKSRGCIAVFLLMISWWLMVISWWLMVDCLWLMVDCLWLLVDWLWLMVDCLFASGSPANRADFYCPVNAGLISPKGLVFFWGRYFWLRGINIIFWMLRNSTGCYLLTMCSQCFPGNGCRAMCP